MKSRNVSELNMVEISMFLWFSYGFPMAFLWLDPMFSIPNQTNRVHITKRRFCYASPIAGHADPSGLGSLPSADSPEAWEEMRSGHGEE